MENMHASASISLARQQGILCYDCDSDSTSALHPQLVSMCESDDTMCLFLHDHPYILHSATAVGVSI